MTTEEIKNEMQSIRKELNKSLSTLSLKKGELDKLRERAYKLQSICPHNKNFEICPYCYFDLRKKKND